MKRSSQKNRRGSPEVLADGLMVRIFRGDYPPGTRLPAERHLAAELGVDRTTLRMALKQLQRMNLLTARHGSGIEVNDYRRHGGLEVLAAMFALDEVPLEGSFIIEALDFWLEMVSLTAGKAVIRMSLDDLRGFERLLDEAIAAGGRGDTLMALMDAIPRVSGSVLFRMLNNSTRSLRERLVRLLPETVDVGPYLAQIKQGLRAAALARPSEEAVRAGVLDTLRGMTMKLRERLLFGPPPARKRKEPR